MEPFSCYFLRDKRNADHLPAATNSAGRNVVITAAPHRREREQMAIWHGMLSPRPATRTCLRSSAASAATHTPVRHTIKPQRTCAQLPCRKPRKKMEGRSGLRRSEWNSTFSKVAKASDCYCGGLDFVALRLEHQKIKHQRQQRFIVSSTTGAISPLTKSIRLTHRLGRC